MGSEWHLRGHLSEPRHFAPQTLPSVAALIASTDPAYHQTTSSVLPTAVDRSLARHTLPTAPVPSASANAAAAAERPLWRAVNHASPHASPTNTILPTLAAEQFHSQHSASQAPTASFLPDSTSESSRSLQDTAYAQTPSTSQRQDSAVFQRIDTSKGIQPIAVSPSLIFASVHRSPNEPQHTISPRPNPNPTTPSFQDSAAIETCSIQECPQPELQAPKRSHYKPLHVRNQGPWDSSTSHEHAPVPAHLSSGPKSMLVAATSEQGHHTHTRQQRYNVRFAANYTSENMPTTQKPRFEPQAAPAASTETIEAHVTTPEPPANLQEPSIFSRIRNLTQPVAEVPSQSQNRGGHTRVERCQICKDVWARPRIGAEPHGTREQAANHHDIARNSLELLERFRVHGKKAEAMYEQWLQKHNQCTLEPKASVPPRPSIAESEDDSSSTGINSIPHETNLVESTTRKRKVDCFYDNNERQLSSKSQKLTSGSASSVTPIVSPPASA